MNRNTLIGIVAGIGIAVAGGVAGFALVGQPSDEAPEAGEVADVAEEAAPVVDARSAQPAAAAPVAAAPAPQPVAQAQVECWEEEVEVPAEVRDDKAIAGTAAGAVIGGALAERLGDDDDLITAAGAAAGAFIGRRAQREYQENQTTTQTVTRCSQ